MDTSMAKKQPKNPKPLWYIHVLLQCELVLDSYKRSRRQQCQWWICSAWRNSCGEQLLQYIYDVDSKGFVRPSGLCWSSTVQCFIMWRTFSAWSFSGLSKLPLWIRGGSQMPRQSEALSYVPDATCHSVSALYQLTGLNLSQLFSPCLIPFLQSIPVWLWAAWQTKAHIYCLPPVTPVPNTIEVCVKETLRDKCDNQCDSVDSRGCSVGTMLRTYRNTYNNTVAL